MSLPYKLVAAERHQQRNILATTVTNRQWGGKRPTQTTQYYPLITISQELGNPAHNVLH